MKEKDKRIIEHIKSYCDDVTHAINRFGDNQQVFLSDKEYQYTLSMCLLQIGELSIKLSDEFKSETIDEYAPWTLIKGMRNRLVHGYGEIELGEVWETSTRDLLFLKDFCEKLLCGENDKIEPVRST